ncbi:hypothetical protein CU102_21130 [Phyllobacterium brassicacearum]|uniref:Transcriptional regulator n=1 Tax=Phyllobacterium brassicacearum TaxID=314235 RepID=A0A2P7BE78_9HYPH|nr:hypothetical protein [Phyllobacterium brassicacearum]PSH64752.1 hypothetical protein CU102_21130 [Phyllobacterium brassicacearum]TDQ21725.1 hypothetical protein DEV91_1192 [Phyllobacterium brassicacearum]
MTPPRFLECLAYLFWSRETLAEILECEPVLVKEWAEGREPIPPQLARWLETLALAHAKAGIPTAYRRKKAAWMRSS